MVQVSEYPFRLAVKGGVVGRVEMKDIQGVNQVAEFLPEFWCVIGFNEDRAAILVVYGFD